jgi:hypothetical protein
VTHLILHEVHDDSFPIIDVGGSVSGIAAAGISFGIPGIVNFNEAKYNLSTGSLFQLFGLNSCSRLDRWSTSCHPVLRRLNSTSWYQWDPLAVFRWRNFGQLYDQSGIIELANRLAWNSEKFHGVSTGNHGRCQLSGCNQLSTFELHKFQYHARRNPIWEHVTGLYADRMEYDRGLQQQYVPVLMDMIYLNSFDVPR